jgi:ribosomal protein S21
MAVNVRVEMRFHGGNSRSSQAVAGLALIRQFKRACNEAGIMRELNERRFFESKSRKRRKQKRQAELQRKYAAMARLEQRGARRSFDD